jgi:nuclear pore complex protein Nup93
VTRQLVVLCLPCPQASTGPSLTLQMQSKMMAYDRAVGELNAARLRGTSCPIVHLLMQAAASLNAEVGRQDSLRLIL